MNVAALHIDGAQAIERRLALRRGTKPVARAAQVEALELLSRLEAPVDTPPVFLHSMASMERRPELRCTPTGQWILVHDDALAETVNFLELAYSGLDRPLVTWSVLARALAELVYVENRPGLGTYLAERASGYARRFAESDGTYLRPLVVLAAHGDVTPEALEQAFEAQSSRKRRLMSLQRAAILCHEVGHALYQDPEWRALWGRVAHELIDGTYLSTPESLDPEEGGEIRVQKLAEPERLALGERLRQGVQEEVACDAFALMCLVRNREALGLPLEDCLDGMVRFLCFADIVAKLRAEAKLRARNRVRFRSAMTRLLVRAQALLRILRKPRLVRSGRLAKAFGELDEALREAPGAAERAEGACDLGLIGELMTVALCQPAPWEHGLPYGELLNGILDAFPGQAKRHASKEFESFYGEDYLRGLQEVRRAPGHRAAGHLLCRSRAWANDFYADPDVQAHFAAQEQTESEEALEKQLARTFLDVVRDRTRPTMAILPIREGAASGG
jgi:hypothetical protein